MLRAAIVASAASLSEGAVVDVKSILNVSRVAKAGFDRTFHSVTALMGSSGSGGASFGECHNEQEVIQTHIATALDCSAGNAYESFSNQTMWTAIKDSHDAHVASANATWFTGAVEDASNLLGKWDTSLDATVAASIAAALVYDGDIAPYVPARTSLVGVDRLIHQFVQLVRACQTSTKDATVADTDPAKNLMICECHEDNEKIWAKMCADFPEHCQETTTDPPNPPAFYPSGSTGAHEVKIPVTDAKESIGIKAMLKKHCVKFLPTECSDEDHDITKAVEAWGTAVTNSFGTAWGAQDFSTIANTDNKHTGCYWNAVAA